MIARAATVPLALSITDLWNQNSIRFSFIHTTVSWDAENALISSSLHDCQQHLLVGPRISKQPKTAGQDPPLKREDDTSVHFKHLFSSFLLHPQIRCLHSQRYASTSRLQTNQSLRIPMHHGSNHLRRQPNHQHKRFCTWQSSRRNNPKCRSGSSRGIVLGLYE